MPFFIMAWFFVFAQNGQAAEITVDTVWSKVQSPLAINELIWVRAGVTLTIEPGVIVKFNSAGSLSVSGKLIAGGTEAEPIIFTSIKDDNYGGDTNGDGAASQPAQGDWTALSVSSGGQANLDHVLVKYGGGEYYTGAITSYKGRLDIANSIITENNAAVASNQSTTTISHSFINNNFIPFIGGVMVDAGVSNNNRADIIVNAANNWWGSADGPCPWRQLAPPGVPIWQIDIQAICGNRPLVDSGVVYAPWLTQWPEVADEELDPVILVPGIMGSWEVDGEWKLDPILHTYDNLWQALQLADYEDGVTLFSFPYEWRQDNTITAYRLKQKIDEVKSVCDCDKVDIVAHSMGGLVARSYAEGDYYGNDIDQMVFLGTPHKGSPKSYYTWEAGEGFDGLLEKILKLYFSQEAKTMGYGSLFEYIQDHIISVKQLLPDYAYLQNSGQTDFRIYDINSYPNNYPYNTFLENLNLADKINQLASSGIKIMNFIGDTGNNTINAIKVSSGEEYWPMWQHGYAEESIRLTGDGTVPEISSSLFIPTKIDNADHMALPTKAQKQVIEYLTGNLPAAEVTDVKEPEKVMVVRIFSPADFLIIAPNGQRLGKDFLSNQAVNEISGAFYSSFDSGAEFAVMPDPLDGEYEVKLLGTGQGEYRLSVSLLDDIKEIDQEFTGNIMPDQARDFNVTYAAQDEDPLGELEPIDTVSPVITINKPLEDDKYLHGDNLIIDYIATDDFSGIATTTIIIDGRVVATTTIDLFDYALGQHSLIIQVVDKSSNQAEAQASFEIIANINSTISDIEEIYERGWFTSKLYKPILINALRLLAIEEKYFDKEQDLIGKLIEKIQANSKLTDKQKQKLIDQYNKKLDILEKNKAKAIDRSLGIIVRLLDAAKRQNQLNQLGYDIIISDINYLRENL